MFLEKLKAGIKNSKELPFLGEKIRLRLLSEAEIQKCRTDAKRYADENGLDEESKDIEDVLRQLFTALSDEDGKPCAKNMDSFRELLTRVEREFLVEEYLLLEQECLPSVPGMDKAEFEEILAEVKKSPDSVMNASNIGTLRRLIRYLDSQR